MVIFSPLPHYKDIYKRGRGRKFTTLTFRIKVTTIIRLVASRSPPTFTIHIIGCAALHGLILLLEPRSLKEYGFILYPFLNDVNCQNLIC